MNQCVKEIKGALAQIGGGQKEEVHGNKQASYTISASENYDVEHTKPVAFVLKGTRRKVRAWKTLVLDLCKILNDEDNNQFHSALWRSECSKWFSTFRKNNYWVQIEGTNTHVYTVFPAPDAWEVAIELITCFGYEKDDLTFELRDTPSKKSKKPSGNVEDDAAKGESTSD